MFLCVQVVPCVGGELTGLNLQRNNVDIARLVILSLTGSGQQTLIDPGMDGKVFWLYTGNGQAWEFARRYERDDTSRDPRRSARALFFAECSLKKLPACFWYHLSQLEPQVGHSSVEKKKLLDMSVFPVEPCRRRRVLVNLDVRTMVSPTL